MLPKNNNSDKIKAAKIWLGMAQCAIQIRHSQSNNIILINDLFLKIHLKYYYRFKRQYQQINNIESMEYVLCSVEMQISIIVLDENKR